MTLKRILVTGSREFKDFEKMKNAFTKLLNSNRWNANEIVLVSGNCPKGADKMAEDLFEEWGLKIEKHPADWETYGKYAGIKRNHEMVDLGADVCMAFPTSSSRGTIDCMKAAEKAGIKVFVFES